jgi:flagellar hook-associated protein 2
METTTFGAVQTTPTGGARLSSKVFGVDLDALVTSLVDAKKIPITKKNVDIDSNTKKITAYQDLQTLSTALNAAVTNLRTPYVGSGGDDLFTKKAAFAQSSTTASPTGITSIVPSKTAEAGSFTLKVNRLATKDVINSSGTFNSNTATPITTNGNFSINGTNIAVTTGMSLEAIRGAINAETATTKVTASVIKVNDTTYKLGLQSTVTGDAIDVTGSDAQVLADLSIAGSGATDASLSAELVYNGVTVTRANNKVTDLRPNVTFDLFTADPASTLSVDIRDDSEAVKTGIVEFVEAYNAVVDFVKAQNTINSDGSIPEDSVLFGSSALRTLYSQIQNAVSGTAAGVTTGINNFRDAGITFDANNRLVIDDEKLDTALLEKGAEIKNLFSFQASSSNSNFNVLSRPNILNNIAGNDIVVNVLGTSGIGTATSANIVYGGNTYTATVQNGIIRAPEGSPLEGFAFGYLGPVVNEGVDAPQTTTIKPTQGLADKIGAFLETSLGTEGLLNRAVTDLQDKNTRINKDIDLLNRQIELYRERLSAQFVTVQRNVSILESIKSSLDATFNNNNDN